MESREWNHGLTETQAQAGLSFFTFLISGKKGKAEIDCVLSNVDRLLVGSRTEFYDCGLTEPQAQSRFVYFHVFNLW